MAKNFFIFALIVLCGIMLLALYNDDDSSGNIPSVAEVAENKLPHPKIIKSAIVNGLSLETPAQNIDGILANEPYKCRTNEKETKTKENETFQEKFWTCSHNSLKKTSLRVHAIDNEIESIIRTGPSTKKEVEEARAQLDMLKLKMDSLKGFNMSQSENSTTFQIRHKLEDGTPTSLSYRMQLTPVRDPNNPPQFEGRLSVSLVR